MGSIKGLNTARHLVRFLTGRSLRLVTAESCTAGLVAEKIARIPGASACFWGSFVCYTREAKITMLGIGEKLLKEYGLVSGETARAMALGALEKSGADAAVSVTGLAGPGGDGSSVPVGTVWIATALRSGSLPQITVEGTEFHFTGSRNNVRRKAARKALEQITVQLTKEIDLFKNPVGS
ncbi:MAG: CinA family protein [Spirochaetaceae bacterium]|jgi:PncC family amidohydrolase|nr:CinA family protein [Spirochaetaceae bacterium]